MAFFSKISVNSQRSVPKRKRVAVMDSLEPRRLFSADVPRNYVQLGTMSVASVNAGKNGPQVSKSNDVLISGEKYYLKITGTYVCDGATNRFADAGFHQRYKSTTNWDANGTGLSIQGVGTSYGAFDAQHEYVVTITGKGESLSAQINDSRYDDNSGGLTIAIYKQYVPSVELTVDHSDITEGDAFTIKATRTAPFSEAEFNAMSSQDQLTALPAVTAKIDWSGTCSAADLASRPTSITIPAGKFFATVSDSAVIDSFWEDDETATATVIPDSKYSVGTSSQINVLVHEYPPKDIQWTVDIDVSFGGLFLNYGTVSVHASGIDSIGRSYVCDGSNSGGGASLSIGYYSFSSRQTWTTSGLEWPISNGTEAGGGFVGAGVDPGVSLPTVLVLYTIGSHDWVGSSLGLGSVAVGAAGAIKLSMENVTHNGPPGQMP